MEGVLSPRSGVEATLVLVKRLVQLYPPSVDSLVLAAGITDTQIKRLQSVQNTAARLVSGAREL